MRCTPSHSPLLRGSDTVLLYLGLLPVPTLAASHHQRGQAEECSHPVVPCALAGPMAPWLLGQALSAGCKQQSASPPCLRALRALSGAAPDGPDGPDGRIEHGAADVLVALP